MRILALDWGTVRIGAAISDPEGKIAFPLEKFIESKNSISEIKKIVNEQQVGKILLGMPKALSGEPTASTKAASEFGAKLAKETGMEVEFLDERFSSVGAAKFLTSQGLNRKEQREQIDNMAACQLLQAYLETKK